MPFKTTPYRLEMIADIIFILGIIFGVILFFESVLSGIAVLLTAFCFSYILYAVAKILRNTEEILERLDSLTEKEPDRNDNE